jgi:hypothetical protein
MKSSQWRVVTPLVSLVLAVVMATPAFGERRRRRGPRFGWIEVVSLTIGAEVFVDGEQVGVVPMADRVRVPVGEHSVKVSKRGFTQHLEVVRVRPRRAATVEADLLALSGILQVSANVPGARVFVDGEYLGDAPVEREVSPGERVLRLAQPGYHEYERPVVVVAGEFQEVQAELIQLPTEAPPPVTVFEAPRRWYERWWVWTIVGAVVVATAVLVPVLLARESDYCQEVAGWPSCDHGSVVQISVGR